VRLGTTAREGPVCPLISSKHPLLLLRVSAAACLSPQWDRRRTATRGRTNLEKAERRGANLSDAVASGSTPAGAADYRSFLCPSLTSMASRCMRSLSCGCAEHTSRLSSMQPRPRSAAISNHTNSSQMNQTVSRFARPLPRVSVRSTRQRMRIVECAHDALAGDNIGMALMLNWDGEGRGMSVFVRAQTVLAADSPPVGPSPSWQIGSLLHSSLSSHFRLAVLRCMRWLPAWY
jgi:hypothetical protein